MPMSFARMSHFAPKLFFSLRYLGVYFRRSVMPLPLKKVMNGQTSIKKLAKTLLNTSRLTRFQSFHYDCDFF